jgi:tetratricopeptide (TPR) repeat protein
MGLSYFGYWDNQSVAARYLKPNGEDKNVSPYQMVNYVNQQVSMNYPVNALYRMGGDMQLLKTLIANNFPVLVEKGYDVDDLGWMGHYLFLMGYDDAEGVFFTYDSYRGHGNTQGLKEAYTHLAEFWRHFNYTFIVLYEPERQQQLLGLLGDLENPQKAAEKALNIAQQQVTVNPNDNWAWFNMGSSYTYLGDYARAAQAFDQAFILGMPWRTLWYLHTPYIAYYAMGRYADILAYAQATENTTVYVEETFFYRGVALAAEGDVQGALQQFATALEYNRNFDLARIARDALQNGTFTEGLVLTVGVSG